jgi:HD-GYP domain-containing protein (c-di-GMP phosphodiesterase class II)
MRLSKLREEVYIRNFMEEYGEIMNNPHLKERLCDFADSFSRDADGIISSLLEEMRSVTRSAAAAIYVVDGSTLYFSYIQSDNLYERDPRHSVSLDMNSDSVCAYVARTRRPIVISDIRSSPPGISFRSNAEFDRVTGEETVSTITAPINDFSGDLAGILQLVNHRGEDGEITSYEDWMLGYALLLIENFFPMISGAFERYREVFHSRRAQRRRQRAGMSSMEEMFDSIRSQLSVPASKTGLPWLERAQIPWSRRDMRQERNISKRLMAFSHYVNRFDDVNTVIEITLMEARDATGAAGGIFYTAGGDGSSGLRMSCVQNNGDFAQGTSCTRYLSDIADADDSSVAWRTAVSKSVINVADPGELPDCSVPGIMDEIAGGRAVSLLSVPVLDYRKGLLAVFQLVNAVDIFSRPRLFEDADVKYCEMLAQGVMPYLTRSIMTRRLIDAMLRMSCLRDPTETGEHVQRVGAFAVEIYRRWAVNRGLPPEVIREESDTLGLAAMLHDIGKVAVPDSVLKKPAKLTDEEYSIIKTHCAKGASMYSFAHSRLEHMAHDITLHHHQRWDGAGYTGDTDAPVLSGEAIPFFARVTAVADVLDALLFPRVYKDSWNFDDAIKELVANSGTQFDPEIVEAACRAESTLRMIAERYG